MHTAAQSPPVLVALAVLVSASVTYADSLVLSRLSTWNAEHTRIYTDVTEWRDDGRIETVRSRWIPSTGSGWCSSH